jgi:hypothetical protein
MAVIFRSVWPIVALMWVGILVFFMVPELGYLLVPNRPGL